MEVRNVLDVVSMAIFQCDLPQGSKVAVVSPFDWCREDLKNRLEDRYDVVDCEADAECEVHLFDLEETSEEWSLRSRDHLVVAFRNRMSHKSLLYRGTPGVSFRTVLGGIRNQYSMVEMWGVASPKEMTLLLIAGVFTGRGRHPQSINMTDSAHIRLIRQGMLRTISGYGIVRAMR